MPTHAAIFFFPFNPGISNFPFFKQFFLKLPLSRRRKADLSEWCSWCRHGILTDCCH